MSDMIEKRVTESQPGLRGLLGTNPVRFHYCVVPAVRDTGRLLGSSVFKLPVGDFSMFRWGRG